MTTTLRDLTTLHALPQGAQYRYDQLNRISAMDVWQDLDISANAWDVSAPLLDYQTRYHYDANGNLLKLKRNAQSATTLAMDDFTYHYAPTNNRLTHVNDAVPATNHTQDIDDQISGNYSYDPSGNLIADQAEFIQHISWTTYGKVQSIQRVTGSGRPNLHFEYGPDGQRITKQTTYFPPGVATADSTVFQFYVRDAQGNVMATYNIRPIANAPLFLSDHSLYGSARLGQRQQPKIVNQGYVPPGTNNLVGVTYVQRGWKAYELSNHLGNVLSVISDRREAGHCNDTLVAFYYPDIIQNNDYYPFGAPMEGRSQQNRKYRYGFNGKEKDQEGMGGGSSTYDYGFRIYNPALGKFLSVDPLTKDYPWYTPYQFAGNKPIWAIDLDGLEEFLRTDYYDINGNLYRTDIVCINSYLVKGKRDPEIIVHHSKVVLGPDGQISAMDMGSTRGTLFGRTNPFKSPITGNSPAEVDRANYFRRSITFVKDDGSPIMPKPSIRPDNPYPNVIAIDLERGTEVSPNDQLHYRIGGKDPDAPSYGIDVYRNGKLLGSLGGNKHNVIQEAEVRGLYDEKDSPPGYMLWRFDRNKASSASYYSTPVPENAPNEFINAIPKFVQDRSSQIGTNDAGRGEFQGK